MASIDNNKLNGWIVLGNKLKRRDGLAYQSPLDFYLKHKFVLNETVTLLSKEGIQLFKITSDCRVFFSSIFN
ncbi:MAG: hypothetical protein IE891_03095 [Flavobacteriaceae bacterium]|nr:hypothetical protein [Flavobacteriaceae bacterium]